VILVFFQTIMELDASVAPHEYAFADEAAFNLSKKKRCGQNIGHRATVDVPGQRGGNGGEQCVLSFVEMPPGAHNSTACLLVFLDSMYESLIP